MRYFTYPEAAAHVRLGESTLREAVDAGKLVAVRFGRAVRFAEPDLDAYMAAHRVERRTRERQPEATETPLERSRRLRAERSAAERSAAPRAAR